MAYVNGTATDSTDLLQQLVTFLTAHGWTSDRSAGEGSGWTASLHLGSNYVHLRAAINESGIWTNSAGGALYGVAMFLGTGFTAFQPWAAQTAGVPVGSSANVVGVTAKLLAGPFTNHYFFCDSGGDNVVVVIEKSPGNYAHLGWGSSLLKAGTWTGGAYFFGSTSSYYGAYAFGGPSVPGDTLTADCPGSDQDSIGAAAAFVRADVDSFTGQWIAIFNSTNQDQGYQGKIGTSSVLSRNGTTLLFFPVYSYGFTANEQFQNCQTSQQDARANLLPILLWARRDSTTTGFSLLGSIPFTYFANGVGRGFAGADEYLLGSDTYKMFPHFAVLKQ